MAPGLMCSLLGGILLAGQKKRGYFLLILRNFPGLAAAVLTAGIVGFFFFDLCCCRAFSSAVPEESVHRRNGIRSGKNSLKAAWDMR